MQFEQQLQAYKQFIEDFKPIVKKLEENGLIFGYHNHEIEFGKIDGKYILTSLQKVWSYCNRF